MTAGLVLTFIVVAFALLRLADKLDESEDHKRSAARAKDYRHARPDTETQ